MRYYSSTAGEMALTGSVNELATTIIVDTVLGLPIQTPFTLVLDIGLSTEEIVTVTDVSGTNLTVTRGEDGTAPVDHTTGAVARHMMTARDLREPQGHLVATDAVHGIGATASVVGTDTAQVLTNKTVDAGRNAITGLTSAHIPDLPAAKILAGSGLLPADVVPAQAWASITSKPSTFAPTIGTTSVTAKAGNYTPAWTDVTSKPSTFAPSAHTHPSTELTGDINARYIQGRTIFVQSGTPSGAIDGDIWFQV